MQVLKTFIIIFLSILPVTALASHGFDDTGRICKTSKDCPYGEVCLQPSGFPNGHCFRVSK